MNYPVYKPYLHGNEMKYVSECLQGTWISSRGDFIEKFEQKFAEYTGAKYAVSVCNGTAALHTALLALGIGPGDEVIVPTLTYVATVNAITYTGARPVFVDSLPDCQMDTDQVRNRMTAKTKAVLAVHLYGHPCEIRYLRVLCKMCGMYLIEDCAESFGTFVDRKHTGTFGQIGTFSFFGNKTITTGEGGMLITDSEELRDKIVKLKNQGVQKGYYHDILGYNYRMTNIQAAIGLAQLEQSFDILARKERIANWYRRRINILEGKGVHWMICIFHKDRDRLMEYLAAKGIETRPVFTPVHLMPMYAISKGHYPVAGELSAHGLNLPSYPDLTEADVDYICEQVRSFSETFEDRIHYYKTL